MKTFKEIDAEIIKLEKTIENRFKSLSKQASVLTDRSLINKLDIFYKSELTKLQKEIEILSLEAIKSGYDDYLKTINENLEKEYKDLDDELALLLLATLKFGRPFTTINEIEVKMKLYMYDTISHIKKLIRDKAPIEEIQNAIYKPHKDSIAYRINRIINTEVRRAWSLGQNEAYLLIPIVSLNQFEEVWITAGDERVRKSHRYLHGKKADRDGWFYTIGGARAKAPRCFINNASENINCRCNKVLKKKKVV